MTATPTPTAPLEVRESVALAHIRKSQTLLNIARIVTAGRDGLLAGPVTPHPHFDGMFCAHLLTSALTTEESRLTALRKTVRLEHTPEIEERVAAHKAAQRKPSGAAVTNLVRGRAQQAELDRLRDDLLAALEPEIADRLARGPADWQFVEASGGRGVWEDATSGARVETDAVLFSVLLWLDGADEELPDVARRHPGPGTLVVLTDRDNLTQDEVDAVESSRVRVVRLGVEYQRALRAKMEALRPRPAALPEV